MPLLAEPRGCARLAQGAADLERDWRHRRNRGMNAYWLKLESESKALKQQMENAFRTNFPESTAIVDPVLHQAATQRPACPCRTAVGQ